MNANDSICASYLDLAYKSTLKTKLFIENRDTENARRSYKSARRYIVEAQAECYDYKKGKDTIPSIEDILDSYRKYL